MNPINVHIKLLDPELPAPSYAKPGDAGADLRSRIEFELEPGERALVPTWVWCIRARVWPPSTVLPLLMRPEPLTPATAVS